MSSANTIQTANDKLIIFKGDDTGGTFGRRLAFTIEAGDGVDLSGCRAEWIFDGIVKTLDAPLTAGETREIFYSHNETERMCIGVRYGTFRIIDAAGKRATMTNTRAVEVTDNVARCYPGASAATVRIGTFISWENISGKPILVKTVNGEAPDASGNINIKIEEPVLDDTVTEKSPNGVKSSGIWSWVKSLLPHWLTSDYAEPATVESVAAKADKATTLAGYGITDAVPLVTDETGNKTSVTIGSRRIGESVGQYSLANGYAVTASGYASHAEGTSTTASGNASHAEGESATASGNFSHAEGESTTASGDYSHAEGYDTTASGKVSHAEGIRARTRTDDRYSYAWNGDGAINYYSHGPGTFSINPKGGLDGFYIGEQMLTQVINAVIAGKADLASLAPEYSATSAYSVGAIVYRDGNIYQCKTAIAEGGEAWNAEHWELRKLDGFFTESNSLLNGRLAYSRNATGLKDRAFNELTFDGTEYNLSTALEAVTPTASGQPRDLLIVATATAATTISFTAGTIKGDKPTIDGSGTWLITLTEYASGVWYCRQIKMEDAA